MGKYKYLAKNIGFLTISNFTTKILSFLLVPLYTYVLTTEEYGSYDLCIATITVLIPILTLNIMESVMRFSLDENSDTRSILSVGLKYLVLSTLIVAAFVCFNIFITVSQVIKQYSIWFLLLYFFQALSGILSSFARGIEKIFVLSVAGVLSSVTMIGCNLLFLLVFKWHLTGYFFANILGIAVMCLCLIVRCRVWEYISFHINRKLEKKLIDYSMPLVLNSIGWWVNSLSDRYIVVGFCGLVANGIYSVAGKIPAILNVVQTIFNQAWFLSTIKDYDSEDKERFFSTLYNLYNCFMVVLCSAIIVCNRILARFLYSKDFYNAWRYVPFLTIAIVFGALSGYIGGIFVATKDSKIFAQSTIIGAALNLAMNLISVPFVGALGAAIATAVSYYVVLAIRIHCVHKYMKLEIRIKRDIFVYLLLMVQSFVFLIITDEGILLYAIQLILSLRIIFSFHREIRSLAEKVLLKLKTKRG